MAFKFVYLLHFHLAALMLALKAIFDPFYRTIYCCNHRTIFGEIYSSIKRVYIYSVGQVPWLSMVTIDYIGAEHRLSFATPFPSEYEHNHIKFYRFCNPKPLHSCKFSVNCNRISSIRHCKTVK